MIMVGQICLDQELLDDHFRLLILTFADVVVPDAALCVGSTGSRAEDVCRPAGTGPRAVITAPFRSLRRSTRSLLAPPFRLISPRPP